MTGHPEDGYVLGIADSVDKQFRQYATSHEYIEFMDFGVDTYNRCPMALEIELDLVPIDIRPDYIRMRSGFFHRLVSYCENDPENYTADDIDEMRRTLAKLERRAFIEQ